MNGRGGGRSFRESGWGAVGMNVPPLPPRGGKGVPPPFLQGKGDPLAAPCSLVRVLFLVSFSLKSLLDEEWRGQPFGQWGKGQVV